MRNKFVQRRITDAEILDWLQQKNVEVRRPLMHGSAEMFFAVPIDMDGGESEPSALRARCIEWMEMEKVREKAKMIKPMTFSDLMKFQKKKSFVKEDEPDYIPPILFEVINSLIESNWEENNAWFIKSTLYLN